MVGLCVTLIGVGVLVFNNEPVAKGQPTTNTVFLTLINGEIGRQYTLNLLDSNGGIKDVLSITPDNQISSLNYSPPPGLIINTGDKFCPSNTSSCYPIAPPDTYGSSSLVIDLR